MIRCVRCLSNNISVVYKKNRICYNCSNCGRDVGVINSNRDLVTKIINGKITHVTIGALIQKKNKFLITERANFPFGSAIPVGHMENGENAVQTLRREIREEMGLNLLEQELIFHETFADECKNGATMHEWFLYKCKCNGRELLSDESVSSSWKTLGELKKVEFVPSVDYALTKSGFLPGKTSSLKLNPNQAMNYRMDAATKMDRPEHYLSHIPLPIFIYNSQKKIEYININSENFINNIKAHETIFFEV